MTKRLVKWHSQPAEHDFLAAANFLSLTMSNLDATRLSDKMRNRSVTHFYAKDILRAARLATLPLDNEHVARNLVKIEKGLPLSPVLLVRGIADSGVPLVIADGYHRVCASYATNEETPIPVCIVSLR